MTRNLHLRIDPIQRLRVRLVRGLLLFAAVVTTMTVIGQSVTTAFSLAMTSEVLLAISVTSWGLLLLSFMPQVVPVLFIATPMLLVLASFGVDDNSNRAIVLLVACALSGVLHSRRVFLGTSLLVVLSFGALVSLRIPADATPLELVGSILTLVGFVSTPIAVGFVVLAFTQTLRNALDAAQRGVALLENSAAIGGIFSGEYDEKVLASVAAEAIQENIQADRVQVFVLSDNEESLRYVSGTGVGHENLLATQYAIPMDSPSALTRSARAREVIVVRGSAIGTERNRSSLDFMPATRAEMIFPILDKEVTLGVIDVQNSRDEILPEISVKAVQILINQFAAALQNARLFHEQEQSMLENKRLFLDAQTSYREVERLNQQLTREVWAQYLETPRRASGITLDEQTLQPDAPWTQRMVEASRRRRPVRETQADHQRIAMPIELRGEVIGAVEIETEVNADYDSTIELMRAVSQRLANSLETARLFEVERETSVQEQRLSELVTQYQSAATVDELLQITLKEMATTLGAQDGSIRLGILDHPPETVASEPQGGEST